MKGNSRTEKSTQISVDQQSTSSSVTAAIAEVLTEQSVLSEHQPLYDYVETDALNTLVEDTPPTTQLEIEFEIEEASVLVSSDGTVVID